MTALTQQRSAPRAPARAPQSSGRPWPAVRIAIFAAGAALAVIVGLDGAAGWRVARVLAVIAVVAAADRLQGATARRRASIALLLGVPAFVAGAGIGVPHAVRGLSVTAVAGVVALAAGIVLLMVSLAGFWRGARPWSRAGVVLGAFAVVQWLLFPMAAAVFATNRAPMPLPSQSPADVGLPYADVTLTAADGVALAAWHVPSRNGAGVVLLHGSGSTRVDVLPQAKALAAGGYGVLLLDARGHGGSGGHAMDFGWYGDADIAPAVNFLNATPDVTGGRVGVVGMSMGGEEAIGAAAAIPGIRAVVAEGVTGRVAADWLPLRPAGIGTWFSSVFYLVQDTTADMLSSAGKPDDLRTAVLAAAPRRLLLIVGGEVAQEGVAGRRLRDADPERVQLWEIPGADHIGGLATAREDWQRTVGEFLDRELRPDAP